jgi:hypothetical protein
MIVREMKSRKLRCTGEVAWMGKHEIHTEFLWRNDTLHGHLEDREDDWRITLKLMKGKILMV